MKGGGRKEALQLEKPPEGLLSLPSEPLGLGARVPHHCLGLRQSFWFLKGGGQSGPIRCLRHSLPPTSTGPIPPSRLFLFILFFPSFSFTA